MNVQQRCSRKCLRLYGYTVRVILPSDDPIRHGFRLQKERLLTPITMGKLSQPNFKSRSSSKLGGAQTCSCENKQAFEDKLEQCNISKCLEKFNTLKKRSAKEAMTHLQKCIKEKKADLELFDQDSFIILVSFEILKHVRAKKKLADILEEIVVPMVGRSRYKREFIPQPVSSKSSMSSAKGSASPPRMPSEKSVSKKKSNKSNEKTFSRRHSKH